MGSSNIRSTVIVVDDDLNVQHQLIRLLEPRYTVRATSEPARALAWLENDPTVTAIVVEQVLRGGLGVELLDNARTLRREVQRVLITRYTDLSGIVQGLHTGTIQRIISNPIVQGELATVFHSGGAIQA